MNIDKIITTNPFVASNDEDKLKEECGIFGIWHNKDAAAHCILGLHALQHRGQEGAGVISVDGEIFHQHLAFGKVGDKFNSEKVVNKLKGLAAIGHNRYSTSGGNSQLANIQPIYAETSVGKMALGHNGNLTNANTLRKELVSKGSIFRTTMDSEVVVHLMATNKSKDVKQALVDALKQVKGAYSMVVLNKDALIGVRDPYGVRPLVLGELEGSYVLASETCAFDIIGADYVRDIEAGEMVVINDDGILSSRPFEKVNSRFCVFEYVYFSRPDSQFEGKDIYQIRKNMGRELARDNMLDVDMVVPVPDSGVAAAIGYAEEAGVPFELGIIRNHYIGRTFIEPTDTIRHLGVKLKHNANKSFVKGKKVVLIDDSIVRGTTSKKIVDMMREAGAAEVHMRIASPETVGSCFYGVDTPSKDKLLASKMNVQEMAKYIGADSLAFLSIDSLYKSVGHAGGRDNAAPQYCDACFTNDYPIPIIDEEVNNVTLIKSVEK